MRDQNDAADLELRPPNLSLTGQGTYRPSGTVREQRDERFSTYQCVDRDSDLCFWSSVTLQSSATTMAMASSRVWESESARVADAEAGGDLGGAAGEMQRGALAGQAQDLDLAPGDAAADAGAEGLGGGLFGGEAGGEALGGSLLFLLAVGDLGRRVDAAEEGVAEAGERVLDARDLDHVGAEAEDHVCECTFGGPRGVGLWDTSDDCEQRDR